MALLGTNLKQADVGDCLDAIVTTIDTHRHHHSQSGELAKRRLNDADNAVARSVYGQQMDAHKWAEKEFETLLDEVKDILAHYGVREA